MTPQYFKDCTRQKLTEAWDEAIDRIWEIMQNQLRRNQLKENGEQITKETVKPAVRIQLNQNGAVEIRVNIETSERYRDVFVSEGTYDPAQGEFDFSNELFNQPSRDDFYNRVCYDKLGRGDLTDYFGNTPEDDYEGWVSSGTNVQQACKIMENEDALNNFRQLVIATLDAMGDTEETEE